jgi:hypothetical protein
MARGTGGSARAAPAFALWDNAGVPTRVQTFIGQMEHADTGPDS